MKDALTKWDHRFYRIAQCEVGRWSKDPDESVGCLIVSPDRRQLTTGYNGFPIGVEDTELRLRDKETKNALTVHAEMNAILNARVSLAGWTMYTTKAPCTRCSLSIIQAGIVRVVCPKIDRDSRWTDDQLAARALMAEAGIKMEEF